MDVRRQRHLTAGVEVAGDRDLPAAIAELGHEVHHQIPAADQPQPRDDSSARSRQGVPRAVFVLLEEQDLNGSTARLVQVHPGPEHPAVVHDEQVSPAQNVWEVSHPQVVGWSGRATIHQQPGVLPGFGRFLGDRGLGKGIVEVGDIHEGRTGRNGTRRCRTVRGSGPNRGQPAGEGSNHVALRAEEIHDPGTVDLDRDRLLVLRYQAFEEQYRRYYPRLHQYCVRRVGDPHASEELAQEAFLRAIKAMPRFAGDRRFYPWMTVIAQRLCIDHHRRTGRVEPSDDIDPGVVEADHEALFAAVDRQHLTEAMAHLAPRHREVLDLREQRGWSYQQIAVHLDVPVTTVEALLHRARKALKREFLSVAGGSRLAGFPVIGWLVFRMARLRTKVTGKTASQLAPVAGSAAAGVAAIGLVLNPFGPAPALPTLARPPAAVALASTWSIPPAPAPTDISILPPPTASSAPPAEHPRAADAPPPPPPVASAGPVAEYSGPEGTQHAPEANAEQPLQVDMTVVQAGLNPEQIVTDAANHLPGGMP